MPKQKQKKSPAKKAGKRKTTKKTRGVKPAAKQVKTVKKEKTTKSEKNKRIISWILAVLIVPAFLFSVLFFTLDRTVVNAEYYKKSLKDADVYNRIINEALPSVIENTTIDDSNDLTDALLKKGIIFGVQKLVPPDLLEEYTGKILDTTVNFLTTAPKDEGKRVTETADKIKDEYLVKASESLGVVHGLIPSCEDSIVKMFVPDIDCGQIDPTLSEVKTALGAEKQKMDDFIVQFEEINEEIKKVVEAVNTVRTIASEVPVYMWTSFVILILLTAGLAAVWWRNIVKIFKWISLPYLITSVLLLLVSLFEKSQILKYLADEINYNVTDEINAILLDLATAFVNNFFSYIVVTSMAVALASLLMYVAAMLIEKQVLHNIYKKLKK